MTNPARARSPGFSPSAPSDPSARSDTSDSAARSALSTAKSSFKLVLEHHRPVAAIIAAPISPAQRDTIYALLPSAAAMNLDLAKRWNVWAVLCAEDWAAEQKRRVPMLPPKNSINLTFA